MIFNRNLIKATLVFLLLAFSLANASDRFGPRRSLLGGTIQIPIPTFTLDFTQGILPTGVTSSGCTGCTRVNSSKNIVAATSPRFDYDIITGVSRGLLTENVRTNLVKQSRTYTNATWSKGTVSVAQNVTGLDGVANSAATMTASLGVGNHWAFQSVTVSGAGYYTYAVMAKAGTANWLGMSAGSGASVDGAFFNLATGMVGTVVPGPNTTASMISLGNGWWLCLLNKYPANNFFAVEAHTADNQALTWVALGTENIVLFDSQLRLGDDQNAQQVQGTNSSDIPTTAATVTTTPDVTSFAIPLWAGVVKYTFDDATYQQTLVPGGCTVTITGGTQTNSCNSATQVMYGTHITRVDAYAPPSLFPFNVSFAPTYGQSLSVGQATPAISTTQPYDNKMFSAGQMFSQYQFTGNTDAVNYASFTSAHETTGTGGGSTNLLGETPNTCAGNMVKQLLASENGISYTQQDNALLLVSPGFGAQSASQLSKNGANNSYARLAQIQPTYGLAAATVPGKKFGAAWIDYGQGENDVSTPSATWQATVALMQADADKDIRLITGQPQPIPFILYQLTTWKVGGASLPTIALAQAALANSNPNVYLAMTNYVFAYQSNNNFHLTNTSSCWMGAYFGIANKRVAYDKMNGIDHPKFQPLQPISSSWNGGGTGTMLTVTMNVPVGNLVLDTTQVASLPDGNFGFQLFDSGSNPVTINSVTVSGSQVIIVAASNAAGGSLHYANVGTDNSGVNGPRGNLRDQQGDAITFSIPTLGTVRMDNWSVVFQQQVMLEPANDNDLLAPTKVA